MSFNKLIVAHFFEKGENFVEHLKKKNIYKCLCAEICGRECVSKHNSFSVIANSGYTNLRNHIKECIPDWESVYSNRGVGKCDIRNHIKVDKESQKIFSWIELIIMENLPFAFVEKELPRKFAKYGPISKYTLMKYMDQLGYECEGVLKDLIPDKFGISFDGWDNGLSTNLCGIFINWYDPIQKCIKTYLLRLAQLIRSDDFGADSHIESIGVFLERVGKSWDNVAVVMGDNTETNLAIARRSGKPFFGCHSHRLNLGVKVFLRPFEIELRMVNHLMVALSSKKNCGRLRAGGCKLRPVRQHEIRWNGTFRMLKQYLAIRPFLSLPPWSALNQIVELLPSPLQELRLRGLFDELKVFEMVSKGLQRTENTLYDARYALNFLGQKHPLILSKVGPEFADHRWRAFESGIVKVQGHQEMHLNEAEKVALEPFLLDPHVAEIQAEGIDEAESYESLMKKARQEIPVVQETNYINTSFVKADTNTCERLFSVSRKVWREDRKAMTTAHFELVMVLKCNRMLWDDRLVYKCRTNPRRRSGAAAPQAGVGDIAHIANEAAARVVNQNDARVYDQAIAPNVDQAAVDPVVGQAAANAAVALAELAAFVRDLDAEEMGHHHNVFLRNGIERALEDHDGIEEDDEVDSDFSDEEFAADEFSLI